MKTFLLHFSYPGIVGMLLLAGLGVPIPEDIPLLIGGYLCAPHDGQTYAELRLMLPLTFLAVLVGDCTLYGLGRRYGSRVSRLPVIRRFLDPSHLKRAEQAFHVHGGKALFIGRFLVGLRAPIFFTAGTFKIPLWKMVAFDSSAALISVPILVLLGWYFSDRIDKIKQLSFQVQMLFLGAVVAAVVLCFIIKYLLRRRRDVADASLSIKTLMIEPNATPKEAPVSHVGLRDRHQPPAA